MRVGILTFYFADNYGAQLQAYALKKYIQSLGHEVTFIDYVPEHEKNFYVLSPKEAKGILQKVRKTLSLQERYKSYFAFKKFRETYINVSKNDKYDLMIVGSDQVWNEKIVKDLNPYLFSKYDKGTVFASYAASIGSKSISDKAMQAFSLNLPRFKGVSVREKSSQDILSALGINSITVVDPVFLLDKETWIEFEKKPITDFSIGHYILVYLLHDKDEYINYANEYSRKRNLTLYYIHPLGRKNKKLNGKILNNVGPHEFVWLVNHAEVVLTNSFHAVSFSIVCGTPIKHFSAQSSSLGERVKDLLEDMEMLYDDDDVVLYSQMTESYNKRIESSYKYLSDILL